MRIVIADDMFPPRMYAKAALRDIGEIVGEAVNGEQAVEMCQRLRPDVILLDISMPGMGGAQAARSIIAAGTARFVCLATSIRQYGVQDALRELGCHTVTKPYEKPVLRREIEAIVHGKA